jgi:formylglycine-generating enzyme required for sulfatase activity
MDVGAELLRAIPGDPQAAFVLADYLEEHADPRGEVLRLVYTLTRAIDVPGRPRWEGRLRELLEGGVRPVGPYRTVSLAPGVGLVLAWVPPGTFLMGSPPDEEGRMFDETQHRVTLSRGFWLGVYPVTQAQWRAVLGDYPSHFKGDDRPAEQVSWEDCQKFCKQLSAADGRQFRMPTEAQWEYACRAGTQTPFHFGPTISTDQANYYGPYVYGGGATGVHRQETTPVGRFAANAWGLYEMHGNVWEWCQDGYGPYPQRDIEDPQEIECVDRRVIRGGAWPTPPRYCRAAHRHWAESVLRDYTVGIRVCLRRD